MSVLIGFYGNTNQRPILNEIGWILNNKIREWINIRSTISRYLRPFEHQLTWKKENNNCSLKCCQSFLLEMARKAVFVQIWVIIRQYFPQLLLSIDSVKNLHIRTSMSSWKTSIFECRSRHKKGIKVWCTIYNLVE